MRFKTRAEDEERGSSDVRWKTIVCCGYKRYILQQNSDCKNFVRNIPNPKRKCCTKTKRNESNYAETVCQ